MTPITEFATAAETIAHMKAQFAAFGETQMTVWMTAEGKWIDSLVLDALVAQGLLNRRAPVARDGYATPIYSYLPEKADAAAQAAFDAGYSDNSSYTHDAAPYAPFEADYLRGGEQANKDDYDGEASLRDAEDGTAYERMLDNWAHSVESPDEAYREEMALQDFERQLAAAPDSRLRETDPDESATFADDVDRSRYVKLPPDHLLPEDFGETDLPF